MAGGSTSLLSFPSFWGWSSSSSNGVMSRLAELMPNRTLRPGSGTPFPSAAVLAAVCFIGPWANRSIIHAAAGCHPRPAGKQGRGDFCCQSGHVSLVLCPVLHLFHSGLRFALLCLTTKVPFHGPMLERTLGGKHRHLTSLLHMFCGYAVACGVSNSMAAGLMQISGGINAVFGIPQGPLCTSS